MRRCHNVDLTLVSRRLTYLLRHGAKKAGYHIDARGFVTVVELLQHHLLVGVLLEDLQEIVRNCRKQRYEMKKECGVDIIRATQGHSLCEVGDEAHQRICSVADI